MLFPPPYDGSSSNRFASPSRSLRLDFGGAFAGNNSMPPHLIHLHSTDPLTWLSSFKDSVTFRFRHARWKATAAPHCRKGGQFIGTLYYGPTRGGAATLTTTAGYHYGPTRGGDKHKQTANNCPGAAQGSSTGGVVTLLAIPSIRDTAECKAPGLK